MNLADWMNRERPLSERLRAAETISAGLVSARSGKGAFLDPSRIQVEADGTCRLREGMGSFPDPGYRAPESIGRGNPTTLADVFVAGVLAYQLLSGQHPFGGTDPDPETPPQPLDALLPEIPPQLSKAVMSCLEPDPEMRAKDLVHLHEVVHDVRAKGALERTQIGGPAPAVRVDTSATLLDRPLDTAKTLVGAAGPVSPEMVSTLVPGSAGAEGVAAAAHAPAAESTGIAETVVPGGEESAAVAAAARTGAPTPTAPVPPLAVEAWPEAVTQGEGAGAPSPAASTEEVTIPELPRPVPAPAAPPAVRPTPPPPTAPAPPAREGGGKGAIVGLGLVAVAGVAGFLWWRSSSAPAPGPTLASSSASASAEPGGTRVPESLLAATETTTVVRSTPPPPSPPRTTPPAAAAPADATRPGAAPVSLVPPPMMPATLAPATLAPAVTVPPPTTAPAAPPTTAVPAPVPAAPAEPASIANIAPPTIKRSSNALVDVHGSGFRPDHQVRVLRGGNPAPAVSVGRQRYMNGSLITVFLQVGSDAVPGPYQMIVVDGAGRESSIKSFQVVR